MRSPYPPLLRDRRWSRRLQRQRANSPRWMVEGAARTATARKRMERRAAADAAAAAEGAGRDARAILNPSSRNRARYPISSRFCRLPILRNSGQHQSRALRAQPGRSTVQRSRPRARLGRWCPIPLRRQVRCLERLQWQCCLIIRSKPRREQRRETRPSGSYPPPARRSELRKWHFPLAIRQRSRSIQSRRGPRGRPPRAGAGGSG